MLSREVVVVVVVVVATVHVGVLEIQQLTYFRTHNSGYSVCIRLCTLLPWSEPNCCIMLYTDL